MKVLKKNNIIEKFDFLKIENAVQLAAGRAGKKLNEKQIKILKNAFKFVDVADKNEIILIKEIHSIVLFILRSIDKDTYTEYYKYEDYKKKFPFAFNEMLNESKRIIYSGDKENANKNSAINSTIKEMLSGLASEQMMLQYELRPEIVEAHKNNWIYIHDMRDRAVMGINCCLFDYGNVMRGGFKMNGIGIEEPDGFETAIDIIIDLIMCKSSQQYGGLTLPEIDKEIGYYFKKSCDALRKQYPFITEKGAILKLYPKLKKKMKMLEYKINCVFNALGQTPFVTFSLGLETDIYAKTVSNAALDVRMQKLGTNKITASFPKYIFLSRKEINRNENSPNFDLYLKSIKCSSKNLYPDYLSLDAGSRGEIYDRTGLAVSMMGCRAELSPWINPKTSKEVYNGRFNIGAVTLILPKYAIEANGNIDKFMEYIDKYMKMAAKIHEFTYKRMSMKKASSDPLFFCEGGCAIQLDYNETIEKALDCATASFGYIGLEEAVYSLSGKHLHENKELAIKIMERINQNCEFYKNKYKRLFAIYGTPSEGLCDKALKKDLKKYGIIKGVTDKEWYTNSFHVDVRAEIDVFKKMEIEKDLFHLSNGGHICYSEWPHTTNLEALRQVIDKAMDLGLYYGINVEASTCKECGRVDFEGNVCPQCGSHNVITISRVCGYLGISEENGESRFNDGKKAERDNRIKHFNFFI